MKDASYPTYEFWS